MAAIGLKNAERHGRALPTQSLPIESEHRIAQQLFAALATTPYERVIKMGGAGPQERLRSTQEVRLPAFARQHRSLLMARWLRWCSGCSCWWTPTSPLLGLVICGGVWVRSTGDCSGAQKDGSLEHSARRQIGVHSTTRLVAL